MVNGLKSNIFSSRKKIFCFIIVIQLLTFFISGINAQNGFSFSHDDVFEIPENDFSFRFSSNGTFESAGLVNGCWVFEKLKLSNSRNDNELFLKVSGQDCNVVIESYFVYNRTFKGENMKRAVLRYTSSISGTQTFNLGLDPSLGSFDARLNRQWVGLNNGWSISPNGTYTIIRPTENVSLIYYGFPESYGTNHDFVDNHYVLLNSSLFVSVTIIFAIIIRKKFNKKDSNPF